MSERTMVQPWARQTMWGWIVESRFGTHPFQLAGPFTSEEAAEAWIAGYNEGRMEERD